METISVKVFAPKVMKLPKGTTYLEAAELDMSLMPTPSADDAGLPDPIVRHQFPVFTAKYGLGGKRTNHVLYVLLDEELSAVQRIELKKKDRQKGVIRDLEDDVRATKRSQTRLRVALGSYVSMGFWGRFGFLLAPKRTAARIKAITRRRYAGKMV